MRFHMESDLIAYLVFALITVALAYVFIRNSREEHSSHIFNLWYIFQQMTEFADRGFVWDRFTSQVDAGEPAH